MCRSFTLTFTCTPSHPSHKLSFDQPCRKSKKSPPPEGHSSGLGLSLSRSISRALESKPDPAALRGYRYTANRACEECDPDHRPVGKPPTLDELEGGLGERHTLSVEEGQKECASVGAWVKRL